VETTSTRQEVSLSLIKRHSVHARSHTLIHTKTFTYDPGHSIHKSMPRYPNLSFVLRFCDKIPLYVSRFPYACYVSYSLHIPYFITMGTMTLLPIPPVNSFLTDTNILHSVFPPLGDRPNFPPVYNDRNTKLLFARIIY